MSSDPRSENDVDRRDTLVDGVLDALRRGARDTACPVP